MKVLVAEDCSVVRRTLEETIRKGGYDMVSTADGYEALKMLQSEDPPQVAVLDWMMPAIDGIGLCRMIRETDPPEPIYIIMVSGRDSTEDLVSAFDAGANDYLKKPFEPAELLARLNAARRTIEVQAALVARIKELEGTPG